ncbi:transthyretin-like family protein [Rhodobium gokarnense]|uniref:Nickel transport protein n=1 Tax=Rhodobium gokarnense TaxID=364296 RepID=A0ABT3HIY1_9HYPH|nr:transthyretin-like family protein [Rhodobium gokarnense]MCW2310216.1 nickel transport protein [Rhodobium gokarnense]
MKPFAPLFAAVMLLAVLAAPPALAHKVVLSVYAVGEALEGEVGFSNGDMAENARIDIYDDAEKKIGETTTDGDGYFTYRPTQKSVHVFRADLGAGHVAEARVEIADLPQAAAPATAAADPATPAVAPAGTVSAAMVPGLSAEQRAVIAEEIRRELRPLRREIAAYKEKNDLQNVLGGIGYIIGLFGVAFYVAARRRLKGA